MYFYLARDLKKSFLNKKELVDGKMFLLTFGIR